jgi:O-antigen/teichoic acid export membrane protein
MTIRRRLAVGLAWMFAGNWAEQATNFIVFIILARLLGAEVFGLAAMATVFVLFAEFLVRETMTETILRLEDLEEGHLDAVFWMLGAFALAIVGLIVLFARPIASIFSEPQVADYVIWATPSVLFIGFSGVPVASLRRNLEFRVLAIRATLGVAAGGVVGITMALMDFGVWSLIAQRVVQVFVNSALAWIAHPWKPGFRFTRRHLHDVVGFSTKMVGLRATELVSLNAPTVVIGSFLGPVALGQYTVAWRLIEILSFVLTAPIRYVAMPGFAHLNRTRQSAGQLLRDVMNASSLVTFPSFLGAAVAGGTAMILIFGQEWSPALPALKVLCLVGAYLSMERLQQAFCIALGHAGGLLILSIAEAILSILAMVLVVDHGLVAIAAAFAAAYYLVWPFRFYLVTNVANVDMLDYLKPFAPPLISSLLLAVAVLAWQELAAAHLSDLALVATSVGVGALTYAGCVWLTMRERVRGMIGALQAMREIPGTDDDQ